MIVFLFSSFVFDFFTDNLTANLTIDFYSILETIILNTILFSYVIVYEYINYQGESLR